MRKYKLLIVTIVFAPLFVFAWVNINGPYNFELLTDTRSPDEIFADIFLPGSGYYSVVEYLLFFPLPILLAFEFVVEREKAHLIVRAQTPSANFSKRLLTIAQVTALFVLLYEIAGTVCVLLTFDAGTIERMHFFEYTVYSIFIVFIFYFRFGILYCLLKDILRQPILAMAILIAVLWFEYQIGKWSNGVDWLPCMDLMKGYDIVMGHITAFNILTAFLRQLAFAVLVLIAAHFIYSKKDFIKDE